MANGEWRMANGEWGMRFVTYITVRARIRVRVSSNICIILSTCSLMRHFNVNITQIHHSPFLILVTFTKHFVARALEMSKLTELASYETCIHVLLKSIVMIRHCHHVGNKIYFRATLFHCFSPPTWLP